MNIRKIRSKNGGWLFHLEDLQNHFGFDETYVKQESIVVKNNKKYIDYIQVLNIFAKLLYINKIEVSKFELFIYKYNIQLELRRIKNVDKQINLYLFWCKIICDLLNNSEYSLYSELKMDLYDVFDYFGYNLFDFYMPLNDILSLLNIDPKYNTNELQTFLPNDMWIRSNYKNDLQVSLYLINQIFEFIDSTNPLMYNNN
jgi:hypothetical protein